MTTSYDLVAEDFLADLEALTALVEAAHRRGHSARVRIASVNSGTLLLASTFEEFIREMGRQYAKDVVFRAADTKKLPKRLTATAWKRTLEQLAKAKIDTGGTPLSLEHISMESRIKFDSILAFLGGDKSQDIYGSLIHNDNNMRPKEINSIFSICDLPDICRKICEHDIIKQHFAVEDAGIAHGQLLTSLNDFMDTRNDIAHALNAASSVGPDSFNEYVVQFKAIAQALSAELPKSLPSEPS